HPHRADRVRGHSRPRRRRVHQQPVATRRERYRFPAVRIRPERKMAGDAKQIAPQTTRVGAIRDSSAIATGAGQSAAIQTAAPSIGVEVSPINVRAASEIEHGVTAFARSPNGGLIVTGGPLMVAHRDLMVALAARHRLPAVYTVRFFVTGGGLISYGPDRVDQWRRAARYVDRILKGEKPGDLPVQAPTKYELVINLKTARALGLEIPPTLLARADEVIE